MIDILTIAMIVGVLVVGIVAFWLFKGFAKVFFTVFTFFMIGLLAFGAFAYYDAYQLKHKLQNSSNIFLLVDGGSVLAGFEGKALSQGDIIFHNQNQISDLDLLYQDDDMLSILDEHYKLFIIDLEAYSGLKNIILNDVNYNLSTIDHLLHVDDPVEPFITRVYSGLGVDYSTLPEDQQLLIRNQVLESVGISGPSQFKGFLSAMLFAQALEQKGEFFLIKQYRRGTIVIYPETIVFEFIKRIPEGIFSRALEKAKTTVKKGLLNN